jgi:hypothetical protein
MSEQRKRANWEKVAAKKHRVDRAKDRELFDETWQFLGGGDLSYEDFEAAFKNHLKYYRMGQRNPEVGVVSTRPLEDGGRREVMRKDEFSSGELLLEGEEAERATQQLNAFSEYLAKIAATERRVLKFRKKYLGGFTRTLSPGEVERFLAPSSIRDSDGREWKAGRSARQHAVDRLCRYLVDHYPWTKEQAQDFVLCGEEPKVPLIRSKTERSKSSGPPAHRFSHATIHLEVQAWVPAKAVRKTYSLLQRNLREGKRPHRSGGDLNMAVFRFVLDQGRTVFLDKKSKKAVLALPPWRDMMAKWNKNHPPGDPRHYTDVRNFRRDFVSGKRAVIGAEQYDLPTDTLGRRISLL